MTLTWVACESDFLPPRSLHGTHEGVSDSSRQLLRPSPVSLLCLSGSPVPERVPNSPTTVVFTHHLCLYVSADQWRVPQKWCSLCQGLKLQDGWQVARTLVRKKENPNGDSGRVWLFYSTDAQVQGAWVMRGQGRSSVWRLAGLHWLGTQEV